jgi:hypothetical protein
MTTIAGSTPEYSVPLTAQSLGVAGQVLVSNGPWVPPSFQTAGAADVVSVAGTANQVTASTTAGAVTLTLPAAIVAPGSLTVTSLLGLHSYAKASLPSATAAGQLIYVSDAAALHGTGSVAVARATGTGSWIDLTTSVTVA